ncbi:pantetheinase-like [Oppia nitens]|uniref:pantetheinase-like n=1 Tax=Oppia nitens TaxID=1686743 RepID=UPI0023DC5AEC|nr:pantetheinase-like [Oppia nitens]
MFYVNLLTIIKFILIIILIINNKYFINCEPDIGTDCFRAAVYEHPIQGNKSLDKPHDIINKNLLVFKQVAAKAKQYGSNILVFPEDGIIDPPYNRTILSTVTEKIPDPKTSVYNACENPDTLLPITVALSCMAKDNAMYIVADYGDRIDCDVTTDKQCPKDGYHLYNTAVAFDPSGALVAKYHKKHLFIIGEPMYNYPSTEFSYFDTPFGRIGLFICFDSLFGDPGTGLVARYGVKTIAFPTYWFDELPFRTAKQIQEGWAINNRVNFLAANILVPQTGSIGSGIYSGINGPIIFNDITNKNGQLLIADIPVDSDNTNALCLTTKPFNKTITFPETRVSDAYKSPVPMSTTGTSLVQLRAQNDTLNVCNKGLCCQLSYSLVNPSLNDESYWFIVTNRSADETLLGMCDEICGLISCTDNTCTTFATKSVKTIFKSIKLSAQFTTNYTYPSVMTNELSLVPKQYWSYKSERKIGAEVSLTVTDFPHPIITVSLYGRCFDRDHSMPTDNDNVLTRKSYSRNIIHKLKL